MHVSSLCTYLATDQRTNKWLQETPVRAGPSTRADPSDECGVFGGGANNTHTHTREKPSNKLPIDVCDVRAVFC